MFAQWSEYASRIEAATKSVKDPLAKETVEKLTEHHANVREARRKIEMKLPEREQLREQLADALVRLRASVDGCVALGTGFKLDAIREFSIERTDETNSAMDLERLFAAQGEFGAHVAKRLMLVRTEHETAQDELGRVEAQLAKLNRDYSAEFAKLQGFIGAAKAVLQINGSEVPTRRVGRGSRRKPAGATATVDEPKLTVVSPGPTPTLAMPGSIAA